MHYLNVYNRQEIVDVNPGMFKRAKSRVLAFINLCIYPYSFELIYASVKDHDRISKTHYDCLKGVIVGLLVLVKRQHRESYFSVDEYLVDFVRFIRTDKTNDPVKFLLSMRAYMLRYMFLRGLKVSFGIEWTHLVVEALALKHTPKCKSYHSLLTNTYVRNLLHVYVVWKNYRETHEEDYVLGENDQLTLLTKASQLKTALPLPQLIVLFESLKANLPSWNFSTRRKAAYAIDTAQDGFAIINRQFSDWRYKMVQG